MALTQTPDLSFDGGAVNGTMFCTFSNQDPSNTPPGCSTALGTIKLLFSPAILASKTEPSPFQRHRGVSRPQPNPSLSATGVFWNSSPSMASNSSLYTARVIFAASPQVINGQPGAADPVGGINGTCNGCR